MNRREFLRKLGGIGLLALPIGVVGCVGTDTSSGTGENQIITATPGIGGNAQTDDVISSDVTENSLAGTCPKGKSCTSPVCQLWTDQNGNGMCDRGIRET